MASIEIAPGWLDAIQQYVDGLMAHSIQAAENATARFHQGVVDRARQDEGGWASLADNITLWSDDGHLMIGVTDPAFVSEATLLEYGDTEQSPNPLLRTLTSQARDASAGMREELESHYGPLQLETPKLTLDVKYKGLR